MGDKSRGLYVDGKFIVQRKDGKDAPSGKHDGCQYFVLDVTHDPHAVPALRAYAVSARKDGYGLLADDLERMIGTTTVLPTDSIIVQTGEQSWKTCVWYTSEADAEAALEKLK